MLSKAITLCYVATPYLGPNELVIEQNILNARKAAIALMQATDYFPVSPVLNTAGFHRYEALIDGRGEVYWLDATIHLLNKCDALYLAPNWESSPGCIGEVLFVIHQMIAIQGREIPILINENEGTGPIVKISPDEILDIINRINL